MTPVLVVNPANGDARFHFIFGAVAVWVFFFAGGEDLPMRSPAHRPKA